MRKSIILTAILLISFFFLAIMFSQTYVLAQTIPAEPGRQADWYTVNYGTNAFGSTGLVGQYGPDIGIGEQGTVIQYADPLTSSYITYQSSGIGVGFGGPLLGYGGMFSPVAEASYGPFAYGQIPTVSATPGFDTRGYLSGKLWGQNISYYEAQYNPIAGLLFSGFGGFSGAIPYGGFSGLGRAGLGLDNNIFPGAFRSARGNIYGGVNLFYFEDLDELDQ